MIENLDGEIWKEIPGYENEYFASNLGRIKSITRMVKHPKGGLMIREGRILKPNKFTNGYLFVVLSKNGKQEMFILHRLIMITFIGCSKLTVDHIDSDKTNNKLENLEYVSMRTNTKRRYIRDNGGIGYFNNITNRYELKIEINGKTMCFGTYKTQHEATLKYEEIISDIDNYKKYMYSRDLPTGVSVNNKGYIARKTIGGKIKNIGTFKTILEAKNAHEEYCRKNGVLK